MKCLVLLFVLSSSCGYVAIGAENSPFSPPTSIVVTPSTAQIRAGDTQLFAAIVGSPRSAAQRSSGNPRTRSGYRMNRRVHWSVNRTPGGNATVGTIDGKGRYTAPAFLPNSAFVTVTATIANEPSVSATVPVTLYNPFPIVTSISPNTVPVGNFTLTINGRKFVKGAQVLFAGRALQTTFHSATQLTARGAATQAQVGNSQILVKNPDPGSAISTTVFEVKVSRPPAIQVSVSPAITTLRTNDDQQFRALLQGTSDSTVTWSVNDVIGGNKIVGTIDTIGLYTAPKTLPNPSRVSVTATSIADPSASATASVGLAPPSPASIPASFFGMTLINVGRWPTAQIAALGKGTQVGWPYIESSRGKYDWSNLDRWVDLARQHKVDFFWSNAGVPPSAVSDHSGCAPSFPGSSFQKCTSMVTNIEDWDDFITALATRYKGKLIYELWNEPEQKNSWTGSVADMVSLTMHMHDIIRSIDPGAVIVSPSGTPTYMDQYYSAGGVKDVDVISVHGYPDPKNNDVAESISAGFLAGGMRAIMAKYGLADKPLWDTEGSWGNTSAGATTDPNLQAAFVARAYLLHWSFGMTRFYWYAWDGEGWGALWNPTSGSSEAAKAYEEIYGWMMGATMNQPCSFNGGDKYHAIYTCALARVGGYQAMALWNTDGSSIYTAPSQFTQYRDLGGNRYPVPSNNEVPIGLQPILLENQ